jgi:serine/threonine protein kinase
LCHRNLSLDAIELNGDHIDISLLDWCIRFNKNAPVDEDKPLPAPGGNNPQYIAPEYFGSSKGVWDGFDADLWTCGLMLYSMVVSSEALFVAPIPEDRIFVELCVKGNIGAQTAKFVSKTKGKEIILSDDLVDLLKHMLKADRKDRLSLDEVLEHPWVTNADAMAPSVWAKNKPDIPPPATEESS